MLYLSVPNTVERDILVIRRPTHILHILQKFAAIQFMIRSHVLRVRISIHSQVMHQCMSEWLLLPRSSVDFMQNTFKSFLQNTWSKTECIRSVYCRLPSMLKGKGIANEWYRLMFHNEWETVSKGIYIPCIRHNTFNNETSQIFRVIYLINRSPYCQFV